MENLLQANAEHDVFLHSMEVISLSPLPVASLVWQPRSGAWTFTFVCKATFLLCSGETTLAPEQQPINKAERHWRDDSSLSLEEPCDIAPMRIKTDVVLVGSAFAPRGTQVLSLVTRLVVADIDKKIEVHCDRAQNSSGAVYGHTPFVRMPLVYELAGGGPDTANPVGVRSDARHANGDRKLPNLQTPSSIRGAAGGRSELEGFGPIASLWPSRRARLGNRANAWSDTAWHQQPLPPDMDPSYFSAAPRDQQTQRLKDDDRITLENLHPDHPQLVMSLPGIHPRAFIRREGEAPASLAMSLDVLWIHTDKSICTLTWRGEVRLTEPHEDGVVLVAVEYPGKKLTWTDLEQLMSRGVSVALGGGSRFGGVGETAPATGAGSDENPFTSTLVAPLKVPPAGNVLPFPGQTGAPGPAGSQSPPQRGATPFARADEAPRGRLTSSWVVDSPPDAPAVAPPIAPMPMPPPVAVPPPVAPPGPVPGFGGSPPPPRVESPWASGAPPRRDEAAVGVPVPAPVVVAKPPDGPGVLGMSNNAAEKSEWRSPIPDGGAAGPSPMPAAPVARGITRGLDPREGLFLLWYDEASVRRMRKHKPFREVLKEAESKPVEPELDEGTPEDLPSDIEDRRDVHEIVARASSLDAPGVTEALDRSIREDGKVVPALGLCAGELVMMFDEVERLKATVATVTPLSLGDESLKASLQVAKEFLGLPDLASAPAAAEGLTKRVLETFGVGKRAVTVEQVEGQVERAMLEQRCYQRRKVFGGKHLRCMMVMAGGREAIPAYLPEALAEELPMFVRFRVRLVAEVRMAEDQYETHPAGLRVVAVGRVVERNRK